METVPERLGRTPVMMDVARAAGVSQKTVSRVINDAPHVRADVRARVLAAVRELGYRPNTAARALVTQRTHVIGAIAVGTRYYGPATRLLSIEHAVRARGYSLAINSTPDPWIDDLHGAVEALLRRGAEGIILEVPSVDVRLDTDLLRDLPVVSNVGPLPGVRHVAFLDEDQADVGRVAARHLLDLGHTRLAHVAGPQRWDAAVSRRLGWQGELEAAGHDGSLVLEGDWSARSGYALGLELARTGATGLFVANDSMAMGVVRALVESGVAVPEDVSVVGVDDVPEAEFQVIPLTTIRLDQTRSTERALHDLVAMIEGEQPLDQAGDPPPLLVPRRSSGPPPAGRP
ncbi:DNA-binding transcriptional regulator, LacI/PurR family [Friedmanniella luteola]|uniref:DNA-binding transcriptional regulator, LacI/PurR family n=1 Tax=Friedmanniella luteola TaxID=546871 RepID=A0A1H1LJA6_9ACTN|nr:LacI family DNA-binding transcriptional regulator [Friedmanniella luteola]SDR74671.1 DNA-binding transcriptional regulator, LacI/PurR family [Friedmanniella luteola]